MASTVAKSSEVAFREIMANLKAKKYSPIYFLEGTEPYFIDQISDYIAKNILTEEEKSFNQDVFYGKDIDDISMVINSARQYPMMSDWRVVLLKEAQDIKESQYEKLQYYAEQPQESTILVICYKGSKVDARKKYMSAIAKVGVVFLSEPIKDYLLPDFVKNFMKSENREIDERSVHLLVSCLGNNLGLIVSELEKLRIVAQNEKITPEIIEKNIGISRSYNVFALTDAIAEKNALLAYRIVKYAEQNPKEMPLPVILTNLFNFFVNLFHYYYVCKKSEVEILAELRVQLFILKKYKLATTHYSPRGVMSIISLIREYDAKGKGVGCSTLNSKELLKELVGKILSTN